MTTLEKEIGKISWGKFRDLVIRYAEFDNNKKDKRTRRGIDIRLYRRVALKPDGYLGWEKNGFFIHENEIENFTDIIQKAAEFYREQKLKFQQTQESVEKQTEPRE